MESRHQHGMKINAYIKNKGDGRNQILRANIRIYMPVKLAGTLSRTR